MKKVISTPKAPAAIGPYSQAIETEGYLFTSGQIPINPATGEVEGTTIEEQAEQVMQNIGAILEEAGLTFANVVKTTCFLADLADFAAFNAVYAKYFPEAAPARSCFAVAGLPKGAKLEVETICIK
ncbi:MULTISPECIES: RidA family protein [Butyricicoccus]|uniref:Reactive intermediate/imine deaminase n=1 Tax=Butyricicoccus porcorum TaxID=1945634 RepID=A0A252F6A9_9FIRM|nr:RidA family protein [Butyricicoccus porcorum]MCI6925984.1 RidA family protein [Butyricicoccus porcorum]MDD6985777.1 RidA family protein [Butyricicoccus porcorum]MDY4484175.1 RidA family protein [Butyricicoccus porcorum]OUM21291.1 reactive intermediate/imine deaminase [Butyricicoccus porcorum]